MFKPSYQITPQLLATLKRVAVLVHDLNRRSPNEAVKMGLLSEARAVSAYASTTIEGNPLPLTAVKQLLKQAPKKVQQSEREVLNYNKVLIGLGEKSFSEPLVLSIHQGVMDGLLVKEKCGAYRKEPVFVHNPRTGEVIFLPPNHQDVLVLMRELFAFIKSNEDLDPVILAGLFHKQFAIVHPFIDGNGRTVRLATTVLLRDLGLNLINLLSFENYYNNDISRYFQFVGERGDYEDIQPEFTAWLEYFAAGILDELLRLQKRLEQTPTLRLQPYHQKILDYLDAHGSVTDKDYAKLVDRAKATRALDFRYLVEAGLIIRQSKGPKTYYVRSA